MGVAAQSWLFPPGAAPSLADIAATLERQTGLVPQVSDDGWISLSEPKASFEWGVADKNIVASWLANSDLADQTSMGGDVGQARSAMPYHPYLWRHISLAMDALGGTVLWSDMQGNIWPRSGAEPACLSKPWAELTSF